MRRLLSTIAPLALLALASPFAISALPEPGQQTTGQQAPAPDQPGVYKGRRIANVMSYAGAPWLERDDREQEEAPSKLIAKLQARPGQNIADIGCGSGYYSRRLAPLVAPTGKVYGVDIQPEMLRMLEEGARQEGITNIVPVRSEPDDPKLPAGAIDWILLVDVYHELQNPEPMLLKMREALSPTERSRWSSSASKATPPRTSAPSTACRSSRCWPSGSPPASSWSSCGRRCPPSTCSCSSAPPTPRPRPARSSGERCRCDGRLSPHRSSRRAGAASRRPYNRRQ